MFLVTLSYLLKRNSKYFSNNLFCLMDSKFAIPIQAESIQKLGTKTFLILSK